MPSGQGWSGAPVFSGQAPCLREVAVAPCLQEVGLVAGLLLLLWPSVPGDQGVVAGAPMPERVRAILFTLIM